MIYLIQVTLYTALLYLVYLAFLKNKSDHNWSRAYLLLNMVLPFVLPLISMPVFEQNSTMIAEVMLPVVNVSTDVSDKAASIGVLPILYISISCLLLGYVLAQAVHVTMFIKRHPFEKTGNIRLIRNTSMGPGSWFNYVFIPATDADAAVLAHEEAHVRHKHSYDIVLMRLIQCVAWPNVILFFIAKELKTVHEFQADAVAGTNMETYGTTLLNELFHTKHFSLSHTFFHHPIKRRIMMLQKNKSHAGKMKVVTLSLLLVTSMLYVQCTKDSDSAAKSKNEELKEDEIANKLYGKGLKIEKLDPDAPPHELEYDVAPEFGSDLMEYMAKNIKYPKKAQKEKIEGRVVVKFVVDEEGNVTNPKIVRSPDQSLSDAALDVINNMPKWKPGEMKGKRVKVSLTLPVSFKLQ